MKSYPSIEKKFAKKETYYFFDKLDGSNIRAEWSKKKGFYKFGTRKRLLEEKEEGLGEAVTLIKEFEKDFLDFAKKQKVDRFVAFFEFFGESSFAGNHEKEDHKVVLIDLNIYKKGFLPPKDFINLFENSNIEIPKLLYVGKPNQDFFESVWNGTLEGMTFEGVIGKRMIGKNSHDYFKTKNKAWLDKLKERCGNNQALYNRLK
ncbi:MAG: hypothetical protein CL760_00640 [Chloroflexi bacterium]|nr:hypothetical protein [Chloroflexota bacterium]|tara:strand:+ start:8179 stop:8790 length:612 start_codon:yes stop_codon:yes gene_type:complete